MDARAADPSPDPSRRLPNPITIQAPPSQIVPLVVASPHSGRSYPPELLARSRLGIDALRRLEDTFVDEIFAAAPGLGAPLLCAEFPRAFVDVNREPFELDPEMFEGALPDYANSRSPRVAAGFGTIARTVVGGRHIYAGKLPLDEALRRIRAAYDPYHAALRRLVSETLARFGLCILLDCHSMPSTSGLLDRRNGEPPIDFVLGDVHGTACDPAVIAASERFLRDLGYRVSRNAPYAGGFTTQNYGNPADGVHALQLEINRALYLDEARMERTAGLPALARQMTALMTELGRLPLQAPVGSLRQAAE